MWTDEQKARVLYFGSLKNPSNAMKNHHMLHTPGYVYVMTNKVRTTLYIGVTSNLEGRV